MSRFWATLPPETVYVPSERVTEGADDVGLVLREVVEDGESSLVLPAYSSLDALVLLCGPEQPWVAMRSKTIDALAEELNVSAVVLDASF